MERVAPPRVELSVGAVGTEARVAEVVACRFGPFFGKGHNVGRRGEVPVVVGPHRSGGARARLDLVDDEGEVLSCCDVA